MTVRDEPMPGTGAADRALMARWMACRDAEAFCEIVRRHAAMVYGTCLRILGDPAESERIARWCFVRLAKGAARDRVSVGGWLHREATRSACAKVVCSAKKTERKTIELEECLDEAIATLPEEYSASVVMHFLEGYSCDASSELLCEARTTVAYRIHGGVRLVHAALSRRGMQIAFASLFHVLAACPKHATPPPSLTASLGRLALSGLGEASILNARESPRAHLHRGTMSPALVCAVLALLTTLLLLVSGWMIVNVRNTAPHGAGQEARLSAAQELKRAQP